MKRIHKIRIKNFKAFQKKETFSIKGKNVLIYGNNGSGKSSLFWALYTFLQSSVKTDKEIQKYFKHFDEGNKDTHQSLKNIFAGEDEDAYIKLTTVDETSKKVRYTISHDKINTNNSTTIRELNSASDFINYNLLQNFYRASHKNEVNLWAVFERDIFPFLIDNSGKDYLGKIKEITEDVPRGKRVVRRGSRKYDSAIANIDQLNTDISTLLGEIETNANDFLEKHFFDGNDVVRINLEFTKKFKFDDVKTRLWDKDKEPIRLSKLQIKLVVQQYNPKTKGWMPPIHRIQSFLNEAQLTRIAIGIRIGALKARVQGADISKILVLDDMLISLDMSNRMDILRIILNQNNDPDLHFFDEFQKIILTHDKGFYELIRRHTSDHQWEYFNFHTKENESTAPIVRRDRTCLEKAEAFLVDGEYDACGNELRKETEAILDKYLNGLNSAAEHGDFEPLSNQLNNALKKITETSRKDFNKVFVDKNMPLDLIKKLRTDYSSDTELTPNQKGRLTGLKNELISYLIKQYEMKDDQSNIITETQDILKRIMNPASHSTLVPLYESELKKAIDGVKKLKEHFDD